MPPRSGIALIVLFWIAVTGYIVHRDLWPRLFGDVPPTVLIELSDEATQAVPARWTIYRGREKVGSLTTELRYDEKQNVFRFTSRYHELTLEMTGLSVRIPEMFTVLDVDRQGAVRAQSLSGKLIGMVRAGPVTVFEAKADVQVQGTVENGMMQGNCKIDSPLGKLEQDLEPVPVPAGQALNPLQPVNRLRGVRPGQRWVIHESNPLAEAASAMVEGIIKEHAGKALASLNRSGYNRQEYVARVLPEAEYPPPAMRKKLGSEEPPALCWVIEYRGEQATAKTWVRVSDGKVLRQEASGQGEVLVLERED